LEEKDVDLYQAIKERRSIRKFKKSPVAKNLLEKIFDIALWAPSGMNRQNWKFFILAGERKKKLVSIAAVSFEYLEPQLQERFADKPKIVEATRRFFKRLGGAPVVVCAYFEPANMEDVTSFQNVAAAIQGGLCGRIGKLLDDGPGDGERGNQPLPGREGYDPGGGNTHGISGRNPKDPTSPNGSGSLPGLRVGGKASLFAILLHLLCFQEKTFGQSSKELLVRFGIFYCLQIILCIATYNHLQVSPGPDRYSYPQYVHRQ